MNNKTVLYHIPPYWNALLRLCIPTLVLILASFFDISDTSLEAPHIPLEVIQSVILVYFVVYSLSYDITPSGITIKFVVIPIGTIPWRKIHAAIFVPFEYYMNKPHYRETRDSLFITFGKHPAFNPTGKISFDDYRSKNIFRMHSVKIPAGDREHFLDLISPYVTILRLDNTSQLH